MNFRGQTVLVAFLLAAVVVECSAFVSNVPISISRISNSGLSTRLHVLDKTKEAFVVVAAGDYDKEAVRARIDDLIKSNKVLMFSFTTCPFCIKAKEILDAKRMIPYTVIELDQDEQGKAIRAEMVDLIGRTSVPAIWIGQTFVGGCNDGPLGGIVALEESGELDTMLKKVGALRVKP